MAQNDARFSRFKDAPWFGGHEGVVVGGAGGIGSWLTLLLSRAGFKPVVYDFDTFELHNMGGQLCGTMDVGKTKVIVLQEVVRRFTGDNLTIFNEPFTYDDGMAAETMFSAFDNMEARKSMFNVWKRNAEDCRRDSYNTSHFLFIDGRLTMEQLQIFCVTPANAEKYEKEYLFDDSEVEDTPCTAKQTSHSAAMIASHMVGFYTNHITNVRAGSPVRNVPFFWEYFIPVDYLNVEG